MNLALLAYEMRAAGIRSLAIELSDSDQPPIDRERETLSPGPIIPSAGPEPSEPAEKKDPALCAMPDCGEKAGGIFNGIARHFCRTHAMQQAGVRV